MYWDTEMGNPWFASIFHWIHIRTPQNNEQGISACQFLFWSNHLWIPVQILMQWRVSSISCVRNVQLWSAPVVFCSLCLCGEKLLICDISCKTVQLGRSIFLASYLIFVSLCCVVELFSLMTRGLFLLGLILLVFGGCGAWGGGDIFIGLL